MPCVHQEIREQRECEGRWERTDRERGDPPATPRDEMDRGLDFDR
jgi:hypothetical protein